MKKYFIVASIAVCSILSSSVFAQELYEGTKLGFVFTPQFSWMKSDNSKIDNGGTRLGYKFGLMADHFFQPNYAFSTGFLINSTGGSLTYNSDKITLLSLDSSDTIRTGGSVDFRITYLEIPLSIKLRTNESNKLTFFGIFGLTPMINVKTSDNDGKKLSGAVKLFNLGYQFGGGAEYALGGTTYLTGGIVYQNGFVDVTSNNYTNNDKTVLNSISLNLGILF